MRSRTAAIVSVAAAAALGVAAPAIAAAGWPASGGGVAAAKGGTIAAPTTVHITGCTASGKAAGIVSGTVTLTWTVSTGPLVTGQKVFQGNNASPVVYNGTAAATFANNTTATTTFNYSLAAGTYTVGVQGTTAHNWVSVIAGSNNTFVPTTAGSNGGCAPA